MADHDDEQPAPADSNAPAPVDESPQERVERERDEFKALAQRGQADLINYRRRVDEERRAHELNATNGVIVRLLPIADDLERAVGALPEDAGSWADGVRMVLQGLRSTIEAVCEQRHPKALWLFSANPSAAFCSRSYATSYMASRCHRMVSA